MFTATRAAILAVFVLAGAAAAQATPHDASGYRNASIESREARQDGRIASGLGSGQINANEAARLGAQKARIDSSQARLSADGRYSRSDYQRIDYRQDKASRSITRARNNRR